MRRLDAIAALQHARPEISAMGVAELYLYGSVARDEAGPDSDVDLLIQPADRTFTIFDLARLQETLRSILGGPVDVHDYRGYLRLPRFRERVGKDLVRVF
jgi:uncharacterized protein